MAAARGRRVRAHGEKRDITLLPDEVLGLVMGAIAASQWPPKARGLAALALASLNRATHASLRDHSAFAEIARLLGPPQDLLGPGAPPPARQIVGLVCGTGCEVCRKPRIRKVFGRFRVRCCNDCFKRNTLNAFYVTEPAMRELLAGLQTEHVTGYNPNAPAGRREWAADYYWRPAVAACLPRSPLYEREDDLFALQDKMYNLRMAEEEIERRRAAEAAALHRALCREYVSRGAPEDIVRHLGQEEAPTAFSEEVLARMLILEETLLSRFGGTFVLDGAAGVREYLDAARPPPPDRGDAREAALALVEAIVAQKGAAGIEREAANHFAALNDRRARDDASRRRASIRGRLARRGLGEFYRALLKTAADGLIVPLDVPMFVQRCISLRDALRGAGLTLEALGPAASTFRALARADEDLDALVARTKERVDRDRALALMRARIHEAARGVGLREIPRDVADDPLARGEAFAARCDALAAALASVGLDTRDLDAVDIDAAPGEDPGVFAARIKAAIEMQRRLRECLAATRLEGLVDPRYSEVLEAGDIVIERCASVRGLLDLHALSVEQLGSERVRAMLNPSVDAAHARDTVEHFAALRDAASRELEARGASPGLARHLPSDLLENPSEAAYGRLIHGASRLPGVPERTRHEYLRGEGRASCVCGSPGAVLCTIGACARCCREVARQERAHACARHRCVARAVGDREPAA